MMSVSKIYNVIRRETMICMLSPMIWQQWEYGARGNGRRKKMSAAFIFWGHVPGSISCEVSYDFFSQR